MEFLLSHVLLLLLLLLIFQICSSLSNSFYGCPASCGNIPIPFPFGIGPNCSLQGFQLSCKRNHPKSRPIPILLDTSLTLLGISNGELRVDSTAHMATQCGKGDNQTSSEIYLPENGPYTISGPSNNFVAIGCDTVAVVADGGTFTSGCVSLCTVEGDYGLCSGIGCCKTSIPSGLRQLKIAVTNMFGYANLTASAFGNCSFAFVVEHNGTVFDRDGMKEFSVGVEIAMRLEWAIGDQEEGCDGSVACGENAYCVPAIRGKGYLCNCLQGYNGNPYLNGSLGCQDVDECLDQEEHPCVEGAPCYNEVPGYRCQCPFGSSGDGTRHGSGCKKIFLIVEVVLGVGLGVLVMLLWGLWFYFAMKKRALIKLKEQYFRQNGGLLLKQQLANREGCTECTKIFSLEELKRATHGYDESNILGAGGYGTVYKGVLDDGTVVAIKKSKVIDQSQIDQFINEVVILTQINHRNVVKLLGCCLETEVPMLVYEFVANGTLHQHIHENPRNNRISWRDRLRIAIETAEALAYLHSAASMPIFHRDVKSSNILLDENFTAKVSDFGISRLVPMDQTQVPTLVQGTLGYLDPEYFQTSQLTAKSDVYSFGVVLVELLTGEKPVSFERPREDSNLAMYFLSSLKCKNLHEFINRDVLKEASVEQLKSVAGVARKCLLLRRDKRPTMKEVAQELILLTDCWKCTDAKEEDAEASLCRRSSMVLNAQDSFPGNVLDSF